MMVLLMTLLGTDEISLFFTRLLVVVVRLLVVVVAATNRKEDIDSAFIIRYSLYVSFKDSIFGGQKEIEVPCSVTCDDCGGSGAKSSSSIKGCTECGGRGGVVRTQKTPLGMMSQVSTCPKCVGEKGKVIIDGCQKCGGHGQVQSD